MDYNRNLGFLVVICSIISFIVLNKIVKIIGAPEIIKKKGKEEIWKWKNLILSWIHALIVGIMDILCFILYPELFNDLIDHITPLSYYMVAISSGYFVYDFLDMLWHGKIIKLYELTVHHIAVTTMFLYNVIQMRCIGYNVVALMAEINSFFLHSRKLMQMLEIPFDHWLYRYNAVLNLLTFAGCRGGGLITITYGMFHEYHRVEFVYMCCLALSMSVMNLLNPVLFWIILNNDFLRHRSNSSKSKTKLGPGEALQSHDDDNSFLLSAKSNGNIRISDYNEASDASTPLSRHSKSLEKDRNNNSSSPNSNSTISRVRKLSENILASIQTALPEDLDVDKHKID